MKEYVSTGQQVEDLEKKLAAERRQQKLFADYQAEVSRAEKLAGEMERLKQKRSKDLNSIWQTRNEIRAQASYKRGCFERLKECNLKEGKKTYRLLIAGIASIICGVFLAVFLLGPEIAPLMQ